MKFDWLIAGAGFTGSVIAERLASQYGQRVLIVDKRDHIGGNAYDSYNEHGVLVQRYGAHIFHTNSRKIWDYLSRFTDWRPYHHEVKAVVEGKLIPVPFNLNSLSTLFPQSLAGKLEQQLIDRFGYGVKIPILKMLDEANSDLRWLARFIYKEVFENYTIKQWDLNPQELDASVTGRVPVFVSRDDRYFQDTYQGIPKLGYTALFKGLLAHPNIHVLLKTAFLDIVEDFPSTRVVFTGPIDEYFEYSFGRLPYRSLRFDFQFQTEGQAQPVAVVNYPNDYLYTRTIEFRHMTGQLVRGSSIAYEYPEPYDPAVNEPYYPIPRDENRLRYNTYLREAQCLRGRVYFAGRLADYKYYNMDQAVGRALKLFNEIVGIEAPEAAESAA